MESQNLEALFPFSKIVQATPDGQLSLISENLNIILDSWPQYKILPSRFLAVTGGSNSGKTFLTNLIIHYYSCREIGVDWLNSLVQQNSDGNKQKVKVQGFSWDSLKLSSLIQCDDSKSRGEGAIYLWPKPFITQEYPSRHSLLWIFHIDASPEVSNTLEQFILLVCSHLVEILYGETKFQLLTNTESLLKEGVINEEICDSVTYILRDSESYSQLPNVNADKQAIKNYLKKLLKKSQPGNLSGDYHDHFRKSSLVEFRNYSQGLHDINGFMIPEALAVLHPYLLNIMENLIINVAESSVKILEENYNKIPLNGENMPIFFSIIVASINKLNSATKCLKNLSTTENNYQQVHNQPIMAEVTPCSSSMEKRKENPKSFESSILQKIEKNMTYFNIPALFRETFNEALGYGAISHELIENHRFQLEKLISIVDGFSAAILRYFSNNYVCFMAPKTLNTFCERELNALFKAFGATDTSFPFQEIARKACEKLRKMFLLDNEKIVARELEMGTLLVKEIRTFYDSEMIRFLSEMGDILSYSQAQQEDNHRKLMKECISLFTECYNLNEKLNEVIPLKEEELRVALAQAYNEHKQLIQRNQTAAQIKRTYHENYASAARGSGQQLQKRVAPKPKIEGSREVQLAPIQVTLHLQKNYFDTTLIFQLTMEEISVYRLISNGTVELLAKEPAEVGLTHANEYVFRWDIERFGRTGLKIYSLRDILMIQLHPNKNLPNYGITVEFLVGKILRKLKTDVEAGLQMQFVGVLISFPFWMRAYCQPQIEAAAKAYAEFTNVQILDENECVAHSFLRNVDLSRNQKREVLIVSQNSGYVDLGVYLVGPELNLSRQVRAVVPDNEQTKWEKAIGFIPFISTPMPLKTYLEDVMRNYGHMIGAAVVSSGEKGAETLLRRIRHFPTSYYFLDGRKAVILGAALDVVKKVEPLLGQSRNQNHSGESSDNYQSSQEPGPSSKRVQSVKMDSLNEKNCIGESWANKHSSSVQQLDKGRISPKRYHSEQRSQPQAQTKSCEVVLSRKKALLELCLELKRNIESTQFQSPLAKNVIVKKVENGYKLAREDGSNHSLAEVEKQITMLEKLGIQNNLLKK